MRVVPPSLLERIVGRRVAAVEPLPGGYRNSNFKLRIVGLADAMVLRVYEHDPALCRKELDLFSLVRASVPVPEVMDAAPDGLEGFPPFALMRYIEGISFLELRHRGDRDAVAQAAHSAGEVLAAIGRFTFPKSGWIAPGPSVTAPVLEGPDPLPRFVDERLASPVLQSRMPAELRARISALVWSHSLELAPLDLERRLAHGDFNGLNLRVRDVAGRWQVAAVLDWEFAVSGSPLMDIGNFLRHDRSGRTPAEPEFCSGYLDAGGELPRDWRRLSRLVDLAAQCALLAEAETPAAVVAELLELLGDMG